MTETKPANEGIVAREAGGMSAAHALGVSIGAHEIRAAAVARDGCVLALEGVDLPALSSPFPTVRQRPSDWARALERACRKLAARCDLSRIKALSVAGTPGTMLASGDDGQPIGDALMHNDASGIEYAEAIAALAPAGFPASALARAQWIRSARHPARLLHQADWIAGLFSGRFDVSDESNAVETGYDTATRGWPDWIDTFAPSLRPLLPGVVPSGGVTGHLRGPLSEKLGLPQDAVCIAGCTNDCAAVLAAGADEAGDAVTILGPRLMLRLLSDKPVFRPDQGVCSYRLGDLWLIGVSSGAETDVMTRDAATAWDSSDPPTARAERFRLADSERTADVDPRPGDIPRQMLHERLAQAEADGYHRLNAFGVPQPKRVFAIGEDARDAQLTTIRQRLLPAEAVVARSTEVAVGMALHAARHAGDAVGKAAD